MQPSRPSNSGNSPQPVKFNPVPGALARNFGEERLGPLGASLLKGLGGAVGLCLSRIAGKAIRIAVWALALKTSIMPCFCCRSSKLLQSDSSGSNDMPTFQQGKSNVKSCHAHTRRLPKNHGAMTWVMPKLGSASTRKGTGGSKCIACNGSFLSSEPALKAVYSCGLWSQGARGHPCLENGTVVKLCRHHPKASRGEATGVVLQNLDVRATDCEDFAHHPSGMSVQPQVVDSYLLTAVASSACCPV